MSATSAHGRVTRSMEASAERVFDAWLDPDSIRRWLGAAAKNAGMGELVEAAIDAKVGGRYAFRYRLGDGQLLQAGTYTEIARPARLAFTWDIALPDVEHIVVDIVPAGTGCELTLTHQMDPKWRGDMAPVEAAWRSALDALASTLA